MGITGFGEIEALLASAISKSLVEQETTRETKFIISLHLQEVLRSKSQTRLEFSLLSVITDTYMYIYHRYTYLYVCIYLLKVIDSCNYVG